MKKLFAIILCLLMLFATACAPSPAPVEDSTPTTIPTTQSLADQGIKNIILIIGDGMGNNQLEVGQLAAGKRFGFTSWKHTLVNTNSLDSQGNPTTLTDSAAAGTAMATGVLTINKHVGQGVDGTNLKTILDYSSQDYGKATGVITTDALSGATPASFSGHAPDRYMTEEILYSQLYSDVDLLCGKYTADAMNNRTLINDSGYTLCDSLYEARDSMSADNAYWLLNIGNYNATDKLANVTGYALDYLSQDPDGFVLMIEQADIDGYGHSNTFDGIPKCVNVLNDTVEAVMAWVGDRTDTAIIVTADHETGGLQISTDPIYTLSYTCDDGSLIYYNFTTTGHTASEVSVYVYGFEPNFEKYYTEDRPNTIKNTNIFDMMLGLLEDPLQEG